MRRSHTRGIGPGGKIPLRSLTAVAVFALASFFALLALTTNDKDRQLPIRGSRSEGSSVAALLPVSLFTRSAESELNRRRLFPYSVVPGGVENATELKNAVAHDPVVAAHFVGFDLRKARIIRLDGDREVYVSYRLDSRVFWTRKRLKLLHGEALITDGKHMARTRCGNRISEAPADPVRPDEPPLKALETPQDPGLLSVTDQPFDWALNAPPATGILLVDPGDPADPGGMVFIPPTTLIPWGGGSSTASTPPTRDQPPVARTPEPGTLLLLSTGLTAAWLLRRKRKG